MLGRLKSLPAEFREKNRLPALYFDSSKFRQQFILVWIYFQPSFFAPLGKRPESTWLNHDDIDDHPRQLSLYTT